MSSAHATNQESISIINNNSLSVVVSTGQQETHHGGLD